MGKSITGLREQILKQLGMLTFLKPHKVTINIGHPAINKVFGNEKGVPSGKMYELSGVEHAGKTTWCIILAGLAQLQHNAFVIWIDLEGTWDNTYGRRLGMSCREKNFYLIKPIVVKFAKVAKGGSVKLKKRKAMKTFLQSIEWSFKEAEEVMAWIKTNYPDRPIFVCCDSVANMQTEVQFTAGATDQNMATNQARAQFLSNNLPRWTQLAENYDAWMFFINQIRSNPAQAFGDPEYTPGGKALAHNAHSRVWLKKLKGGKMLLNGKVIGLKGKAINKKNKVGGGSEAYLDCGYQINWSKPIKRAMKFMSIKEAEKD
jgi:RecA/RadA recombinase